ncbi:MAG: hypothetical protein AB7T31_09035 [Gemmatimonadales bacterium]
MRTWAGWIGAALVLSACGSSTDVEIDPAVEPFVGTWDAVAFTVTGDDPPHTVVDVLTLGPFWIRVEPSGSYQAVLEFLGGQAEFGKLTVQSSTVLILDANDDPPAPSTYVFATTDSLVMDGATEFDFNLDGTDEPGQAHIEIVRR